MKRVRLLALILFIHFALFGWPQAPGKTNVSASDAKAFPVYVSDFELRAEEVQADHGLLGGGARPGILPSPLRQPQDDPQTHARKLVVLMSSCIIADLRKAGYNALPLSVADPRPKLGEWVHGVFAEVDAHEEARERKRASENKSRRAATSALTFMTFS